MSERAHPKSLFVSVGELSGDMACSELLAPVLQRQPDLHVFGVTGPHLRKLGVHSLAHMEDHAVMGVWDVARKLNTFARLEARLLEQIDQTQPEVALLVDYPGFHLRFADFLRIRSIYTIQYIAPKLWAWGKSRLEALKQNIDLVLGILPFEQGFFERHQVPYLYGGCPLIQRIAKAADTRQTRACSGLFNAPPQAQTLPSEQVGKEQHPAESRCLALLPGSRNSEVRRLFPDMLRVAYHMRQRWLHTSTASTALSCGPFTSLAVPMAGALKEELFVEIWRDVISSLASFESRSTLQAATNERGEQITPLSSADLKGLRLYHPQLGQLWLVRDAGTALMHAADVALVASGTATLECALAQTPMAVMYKMDAMSYRLGKLLIDLPYVSLANLVAEKKIVEEYIQVYKTEDIAADLMELFDKGHPRTIAMTQSFQDMTTRLNTTTQGDASSLVERALTGERTW